jgi:hypothetical protein
LDVNEENRVELEVAIAWDGDLYEGRRKAWVTIDGYRLVGSPMLGRNLRMKVM